MAQARSDSREAFGNAITAVGSQTAMARLLGVSQMAVSRWSRGVTELPGEHVLKIEAVTGVSKHDLRPDLYPREGATNDLQDRPSDVVPAR